jgi:hypothetical protein
MQIVAAAYSLAGAGGSETYLVTVADHLERLGHDVWLHSPELGASTDAAQALGLRVVAARHELPPAPDVLLVQDGAIACELAASHPLTPQVFVAHSDIFDLQLPPQLPDLVAAVVVLYDRVERRIRALAQPVADIVRLTQPIDVERFKPSQPLRSRPRVAMTLGNYVHGQRLALLRRACDRTGIELRHVGVHGEGQRPAALVLNDADIVFGKARVILEAMACGRAAYVFDHNGGDGWVTAESYAQLAADNLGGQGLPDAVDEDRIVRDLAAYDPAMGLVNRDLVVAHHAAGKHAAALVEVLARAAPHPRPAAIDAPLLEIGRLLRLYHRADVQAFAMRAETEAFAGHAHASEQRAQELESRIRELDAARLQGEARADALAAQAAGLGAELAATRAAAAAQATAAADQTADVAAHAAEAARLARLLSEVTGTRRWRALQTLLTPADRLRSAASRLSKVTTRQRPSAAPPAPDAPVRPPSAPPGPEPSAHPASGRPRSEPSAHPASGRPRSEPSAHPASGRPRSEPPAPFVVGVPRSGTTLLRLQLDSHPRLAIGPETGFGVVAGRFGAAGVSPDELLAALTELDTWPDLALDQDAAMRALELAQRPWSLGNGLRAIYAALAARDGKPRWGDKTPVHSACMPAIAAALPEARFIHIIRDGRDVAASVREQPFAPGDGSIEAIATDWRDRIATARADAAGLAHYREVRYERLVIEPEAVLRELCDFVELDFDAAMLRAHERAADVLARLPEHRPEGAAVATRAERSARHAHLLHPPDPTRAGRWRETLTADEASRFQLTAGGMLCELGYEPADAPTPQPTA